MRESSVEIAKLCESWWGKLADNTKVDQYRFAEQLLGLLGWQCPSPIEPRASLAHLSTVSYILRGSAQTAIVAHFVAPGSLEPPSLVVQRGLDFCEATRTLVNESFALNADGAFITDLYRSYFYDVRTDELILCANSPAEFKRDFVDVLMRANVERGSLDEVRRQPRSYAARQLREWCHHWCEAIVADSGLSEEVGYLAIDRLLVLRYLFDHDILKRTGWLLRKRFSNLVAKAFSVDPRSQVCHTRAKASWS